MTRRPHGQFAGEIVEMARGVELPSGTLARVRTHMETCAACAERYRRECELHIGLRALARMTATEGSSRDLEPKLAEAFRHAHAWEPSRRWDLPPAWLAAAAAVCVAAGAGVWGAVTLNRPVPPGAPAAGPSSAGSSDRLFDDFSALPHAHGLPQFESGLIVRVDLPVAALPAYGVEMVPDPTKTQVQADLLVGQDGQPRAIRLVRGQGAGQPGGTLE